VVSDGAECSTTCPENAWEKKKEKKKEISTVIYGSIHEN